MADHIFATPLFSYTFRLCLEGRKWGILSGTFPNLDQFSSGCPHRGGRLQHDMQPRPPSHKSPFSNLQSQRHP